MSDNDENNNNYYSLFMDIPVILGYVCCDKIENLTEFPIFPSLVSLQEYFGILTKNFRGSMVSRKNKGFPRKYFLEMHMSGIFNVPPAQTAKHTFPR